MIPLVDLKAQYRAIKPEIDSAIEDVLLNTSFVGGRLVENFEQQFAGFCGAQQCLGVANGTDALALILRALGIGPGDEVITVSHTFAATLGAIIMCGARPVLVDIDPQTMLLDPALVEGAVSERTKAIVPVHLYGQPCDMDALTELARAHKLALVEDAAQAHGARWKGQMVGNLGDAASFSFYPGKNLGAYGDAGAIVSDDVALLQQIRQLANHGRRSKYEHQVAGVNSRLDALQAAILSVKLSHLKEWTRARQEHADHFSEALQDLDLKLPIVRSEAESAWHLYVIRTERRDELANFLAQRQIATGMHYPIPNHLQDAFEGLGYKRGSLPHTEQAASSLLSLPLYAELNFEQRDSIVDAVRAFFG